MGLACKVRFRRKRSAGDDSVAWQSWCSIESPSRDKPPWMRWRRSWRTGCARLGAAVEIVPNSQGGDHLIGRFSGPAGSGRLWCSATSTPSGRSGRSSGCPSDWIEAVEPTGPASST